MTAVVITHQFSVSEYEQMHSAGIFREDQRIELLDGKVVEMAAAGTRHVAVVRRLHRLFLDQLGDRATISLQDPVLLGDRSLPEPDVALLVPRSDDYEGTRPTAADILLIVEVADSSLDYDRLVKEPIYAAAGIREYWIIDLVENRIEARREPHGHGYDRILTFGRGEVVSPLAYPEVVVPVLGVLPSSFADR